MLQTARDSFCFHNRTHCKHFSISGTATEAILYIHILSLFSIKNPISSAHTSHLLCCYKLTTFESSLVTKRRLLVMFQDQSKSKADHRNCKQKGFWSSNSMLEVQQTLVFYSGSLVQSISVLKWYQGLVKCCIANFLPRSALTTSGMFTQSAKQPPFSPSPGLRVTLTKAEKGACSTFQGLLAFSELLTNIWLLYCRDIVCSLPKDQWKKPAQQEDKPLKHHGVDHGQ